MVKQKQSDETSCWTWRNLIITWIVLAVLGILVYVFAPLDAAIDAILPKFNETGTSSNNGDNANDSSNGNVNNSTIINDVGDSESSDNPPPPLSPIFNFYQCEYARSCCNGLESICDLRVDEVMFAGVHNAMATREDGFLFAPNHFFQLEGALEAGYRAINLDVCNCNGKLQFCHNICSLGNRDVTEVFLNINRFLQDNPSEILLLSLQINSDVGQDVELSQLYDMMTDVDSFTDKIYIHNNSQPEWPTLKSLVQTNKRLIMFHYNGQTCDDDTCPPGLHYYWDFAVETEYTFDDVEEVGNELLSCQITRGNSGSKAFFGVNNFVTLPDADAASVINTLEFAKERVKKCSEINGGLDVNILYVDYWSIGDLPELVQRYNSELVIKNQRKTKTRFLRHS